MTLYYTPGGVPYEELEGYPVYSGSYDRIEAQVQWRFQWIYIDQLLAEMMPPVIGGVQPYRLTFPGMSWMPMESFTIRPQEGLAPVYSSWDGHNTYSHAIAEITFASQKYDEDPEDYTLREHRYTIGAEYIRVPGNAYKYKDDNGKEQKCLEEDVNAGIMVTTIEHSLTLHKCNAYPKSTIESKIGKVNSATELFDATPETLLFLGADGQRTISLLNDTFWTVELRFSEKRVQGTKSTKETAGSTTSPGWNHFYLNEGTATAPKFRWHRIYDDQNNPVYQSTTFADLLTAFIA